MDAIRMHFVHLHQRELEVFKDVFNYKLCRGLKNSVIIAFKDEHHCCLYNNRHMPFISRESASLANALNMQETSRVPSAAQTLKFM